MGRIIIFFVVIIGTSTCALGKTKAELEADVDRLYGSIEKQAQTLKEWKTKNDALEKMVAILKRTRKRLQADVVRLRVLVRKAGWDPTPDTKGNISNHIKYKGTMHSQYWLEMLYQKHNQNLAFINGEYVDLRKCPTANGYKVLQILGDGNILAQMEGMIIKISGLPVGYVDGDSLPLGLRLINTGTYQYITTQGSNKTIRQYTIAKTVSAEQFIQAIEIGYDFE